MKRFRRDLKILVRSASKIPKTKREKQWNSDLSWKKILIMLDQNNVWCSQLYEPRISLHLANKNFLCWQRTETSWTVHFYKKWKFVKPKKYIFQYSDCHESYYFVTMKYVVVINNLKMFLKVYFQNILKVLTKYFVVFTFWAEVYLDLTDKI